MQRVLHSREVSLTLTSLESATRHSQCFSMRELSFQTFPYRHTSLPVPHSHIHTALTPNAAWDKFQRFHLFHDHLPTTSLPQSPPKNSNLINARHVTSPEPITNTGSAFKKWHASNTDGWILLCSTRPRTGNERSSSPYVAQQDTETHSTHQGAQTKSCACLLGETSVCPDDGL